MTISLTKNIKFIVKNKVPVAVEILNIMIHILLLHLNILKKVLHFNIRMVFKVRILSIGFLDFKFIVG